MATCTSKSPSCLCPSAAVFRFFVKMVYDSRVWKILDNGWTQSWQPPNVPNSNMGWRLVTSLDNVPQIDSTFNECLYGSSYYTWWKGQNYRYTDTSGTVRRFPLYFETTNPCHTPGSVTTSGPSLDVLGQQMNLAPSSHAVSNIIAADGTRIYQ